jgi:uncharacterized protein
MQAKKYSLIAIKLLPVFLAALLVLGAYLVKFDEPVLSKLSLHDASVSSCNRSVTRVVVNKTNVDICLERVLSDSDIQKGLSSRKRMSDGPQGDSVQGMLFDLPPKSSGIWMKGMLMPIDIIWLDASGKIVAIEAGAQPSTYPKVFGENLSTTRYVIELGVNDSARLKLAVGDVLSIPVRDTIEP